MVWSLTKISFVVYVGLVTRFRWNNCRWWWQVPFRAYNRLGTSLDLMITKMANRGIIKSQSLSRDWWEGNKNRLTTNTEERLGAISVLSGWLHFRLSVSLGLWLWPLWVDGTAKGMMVHCGCRSSKVISHNGRQSKTMMMSVLVVRSLSVVILSRHVVINDDQNNCTGRSTVCGGGSHNQSASYTAVMAFSEGVQLAIGQALKLRTIFSSGTKVRVRYAEYGQTELLRWLSSMAVSFIYSSTLWLSWRLRILVRRHKLINYWYRL